MRGCRFRARVKLTEFVVAEVTNGAAAVIWIPVHDKAIATWAARLWIHHQADIGDLADAAEDVDQLLPGGLVWDVADCDSPRWEVCQSVQRRRRRRWQFSGSTDRTAGAQ